MQEKIAAQQHAAAQRNLTRRIAREIEPTDEGEKPA
jgi:hypothetical protein